MKFGVCGGADIAPVAAAAGFDYLEGSVGGLLCPLEPETEFRRRLAATRALPLPCPALNCLVPGELKIVGPERDPGRLADYLATACRRAREADVQILVFGSGGARRIPDGFPRAEAWRQLLEFGANLATQAGQNGVTIAVEPLNRKECNVLTTVGESADLVRAVDHPAFRLLVDGYHWALDQDSAAAVATSGDLLVHTHVATVPGRLAPGAEDCDLAAFFRALAAVGYDGRVSIEGNLQEAATTLPRALALMRTLAAQP
jgi:sugar phosphate isomerase/epimerase